MTLFFAKLHFMDDNGFKKVRMVFYIENPLLFMLSLQADLLRAKCW